MNIQIQFVQIPRSETFETFIQKKLSLLAEKYDWLIKAQVNIKQENDPSPKGKICEIELSAPGPRIFSSSNEESFELAVTETIQDLERQLKKRKSKMKPHL
ncbi:ribosome hibernation-promoting factor, HPF/YfiA family [Sungkyunkwania multivorans]|uniref:Ribosome hibernation-promoting factor, HPF/YfiA family n=1 Tax=Sungkyunkwania multivorans TaxID=1173618 RepID=A0ABW3D2J7_9FLAO